MALTDTATWRAVHRLCIINDYWVNSIVLPFLIYSIAAIGVEHLAGLLRAAQPWNRRVHGGGGLRLLQADGRVSDD
jgi:hypothetical protein